MAWDADKNLIYFGRLKNIAGAWQNIREELQRLLDIESLEASPNGVDDPAFVDTAIASKAAAKNLIGILGDMKLFMENGSVGPFNRKDYLVPFIDTTPA